MSNFRLFAILEVVHFLIEFCRVDVDHATYVLFTSFWSINCNKAAYSWNNQNMADKVLHTQT